LRKHFDAYGTNKHAVKFAFVRKWKMEFLIQFNWQPTPTKVPMQKAKAKRAASLWRQCHRCHQKWQQK